MSGFRDSVDTDYQNVLHGDFAEPVSVANGSGSTVTIQALFEKTFKEVNPETQTVVLSSNPRVAVWAGDIPFTLKQGQQVTARGKTYKIESLEPDGEGGILLYLVP